MSKGRKIEDPWVEVKGAQLLLYLVRWLSVIWWPLHLQSHICNLWRSSHKNMDFNFIFLGFQPSAGDLCIAIFTSIFSTWGLVKCHPKNLSSGNICKIVFPSPLQFSLWRHALNTYRTQPCLVTNLVMNMVTNLVITKFGDELCDIFVTSFGDSLNWVMIFVTFLSLNLVGHQFEWWFWWQIGGWILWFTKFGANFCDAFGD